MKKVVIAGSAKIQEEIRNWVEYWSNKEGYSVLNYPKAIPEDDFEEIYPDVHKKFFEDVTEADVLFIANGKRGEVEGYIGYETFAELGFGVVQKLVNGKNLKIILAKMPAREVGCYDEVVLWKKLGWIDEVVK